MINKVGNCYSLFPLAISSLIDRYAQAITCLPSVFQIWILVDGANDSFAPDARSVGFKVPPEELPTIRSLLPLAKPQISSLVADSHSPSSGTVAPEKSLCLGAGADRTFGRLAWLCKKTLARFVLIETANRFLRYRGNRPVPLPRLFLAHNPTPTVWCLRRLPHTLTVPAVDTDEVDRPSPFGPTTSMVQL